MTATAGALAGYIDAQVGRCDVSDWLTVDQPLIDGFADATHDWMFLHVDPVAATRTEFGGTIAHGFLLLSLLAPLRMGIERGSPPGMRAGLNYGFDRIRFVAPVRAGRRVRGRFTIAELSQRGPGQLLEQLDVVQEIEGEPQPALIARWLTMYLIDAA